MATPPLKGEHQSSSHDWRNQAISLIDVRLPQIRFVSDAILVDPEYPSGAITAEPFGRPLDNTRSNQVIRASVVTHIFVEGGDCHTFTHHNILTVFSGTGFPVRQAQQLAKQSIEIRTDPNWR